MVHQKHPAIVAFVDAARERFGQELVIVDHWTADERALGVALRQSPGHLAYVAVEASPVPPTFFVALERETVGGDELPYELVGEYEGLSGEQALAVAANHLARRG